MTKDREILDLIDQIKIVETESQEQKLLAKIANPDADRIITVAFVNAHALNMCYDNPDFMKKIMNCDYILRDGIGMKILYLLLGQKPGLNLNGTDFIPKIIDRFKGRTAALYGTEKPYLDNASKTIGDKGINVVNTMDGFQAEETYVSEAANHPADLIILAMGMPKQENVAYMLEQSTKYPTTIVCGGAILDFMGGKVTRAPEFFRKYGLEWLYRLSQEPKRLFKRYVIGNAIMLYHAVILAYIYRRDRGRIV